MRYHLLLIISTLLFLVASASAAPVDATDKIEILGNPYKEFRYSHESKLYARNVWDMIAYDGQLFLGGGNSSNSGPAGNAGPVPIIRYDPESDKFQPVFMTDEEQIDRFYNFDGTLYIPGHDPKEGWDFGNFYTLTPGRPWVKHRNIPNGIHTFSMAFFRDHLFGALTAKNKESIAISDNGGTSWETFHTGTTKIYDFLVVNNKLFAFGSLYPGVFAERLKANRNFVKPPVLEFNNSSGFEQRHDLASPDVMFPDTDLDPSNAYKVLRPQVIGDTCVYIGAKTHNGHHSLPFGVYVAKSLDRDNIKISKVPLPEGHTPWDILVSENSVYILSGKQSESPFKVSIWQSSDAGKWQELLFFESTTFARSFEILGDSFYLSLGSEFHDRKNRQHENLSQDTGKIFRINIP